MLIPFALKFVVYPYIIWFILFITVCYINIANDLAKHNDIENKLLVPLVGKFETRHE